MTTTSTTPPQKFNRERHVWHEAFFEGLWLINFPGVSFRKDLWLLYPIRSIYHVGSLVAVKIQKIKVAISIVSFISRSSFFFLQHGYWWQNMYILTTCGLLGTNILGNHFGQHCQYDQKSRSIFRWLEPLSNHEICIKTGFLPKHLQNIPIFVTQ